MSYMDGTGQWRMPWDPPPAQTRRSAALWTSLARAPSLSEAQELARRGIRFANFDLKYGGSPEVIRTLKQAGIYVFAYNIGNGGGGAWGEPTGLATGQAGINRIREATRRALQAGADGIHLDNPDKLGEAQLERLMDAQVQVARSMGREPALHLKNAPREYANILSRRPDLLPHVKIAVVEHLMTRVNDSKRLASMGIPVYGIEFQASHIGSPTQSAAATRAFFNNNSWVSGMISMKHERSYEGRTGESMMRDGAVPMSQDMWTRRHAEAPQGPVMMDPRMAHLPVARQRLAEAGNLPMMPANDPYAGHRIPFDERGQDMGNNRRRSRGRTPTPPPVPPDADPYADPMMNPAYDPRLAGRHVMDPRLAGIPPHMRRPAEKDGMMMPPHDPRLAGPPIDPRMMVDPRMADPRYAAMLAHARRPSAEKDGTMVMPEGELPPGGPQGGHPLLAAMAHLGAMSGRGHQPTAELQGFARFGDFMKEVMGVPVTGGPGMRPYTPVTAQELGVISQIIGVNATRGADGQFSEDVRQRVGQMAEQARAFQTQAGLAPDGVIGPRTGPAMMNTTVMDMVLAGRAPNAGPTPNIDGQAADPYAPPGGVLATARNSTQSLGQTDPYAPPGGVVVAEGHANTRPTPRPRI